MLENYMDKNTPYKMNVSFPGNLEYVSPIRKFISEVLVRNNFSEKFAYRSEVIIDEICTNAISYGCRSAHALIEFECLIYPDRIDFQVKDEGGNTDDVNRLRVAVEKTKEKQAEDVSPLDSVGGDCLGLEIVRMLSEKIDLQIDQNNVTTIRIIRKCKATDN